MARESKGLADYPSTSAGAQTCTAAAAVDVTFPREVNNVLLQPWGAHTLYLRINETGATLTCGKVICATLSSPIMLPAIRGKVFSLWNAGATSFIWNGAGQNGAFIGW